MADLHPKAEALAKLAELVGFLSPGLHELSRDPVLADHLINYCRDIDLSAIDDPTLDQKFELFSSDILEHLSEYQDNLVVEDHVQSLFDAAEHKSKCCQLVSNMLTRHRIQQISNVRRLIALEEWKNKAEERLRTINRVIASDSPFTNNDRLRLKHERVLELKRIVEVEIVDSGRLRDHLDRHISVLSNRYRDLDRERDDLFHEASRRQHEMINSRQALTRMNHHFYDFRQYIRLYYGINGPS